VTPCQAGSGTRGQQPRRGRAVGRDDHRARLQHLAAVQSYAADCQLRDRGAGAHGATGQPAGQLSRQRAHAGGRQRAAATHEASPDQVEHPRGGLQRWVEKDSREKRPEYLADGVVRDTPARELLGDRPVGRAVADA